MIKYKLCLNDSKILANIHLNYELLAHKDVIYYEKIKILSKL